MSHGWTAERRARQAELIRSWKPWQSATGPKTLTGKSVASMNADKGYQWTQIHALRRLLRKIEVDTRSPN
ncbi:MAG: hypothetical protein PHO76_12625 [Methylotenera sp.]|nr:hypothetical protein [Methylotenera sp.]MDD4926810.1 hypothetical protein [Methylotenera sp.]